MIQRIKKMFTAMPIRNAVFDTKNVKNKQENTYSIRIIEEENEALRNRITELKNELNTHKNTIDISNKFKIADYFSTKEFTAVKNGNVVSIRFYGKAKQYINSYTNLIESAEIVVRTLFFFPVFNASTESFNNIIGQARI